ncbi:MAG: imidazole glycerol phosphate synthase subunit HisH [Thermoanaerobaculia bacterium]
MSTPVTLVDYGVGNIASVTRAFRRLGAEVALTADPTHVASASRIVLPGVGAFAPARKRLAETGLDAALLEAVRNGSRLLGLCLGFQLLFDESEEYGKTAGLGVVVGRIVPFPGTVRVPHVGWNALDVTRGDGLFSGVPSGTFVYFVHSYRPEGVNPEDVAATCDHGGPFPAAIQCGNVWGCQFHPEKSSEAGRKLLLNFLAPEPA